MSKSLQKKKKKDTKYTYKLSTNVKIQLTNVKRYKIQMYY